MSAFVYVCMYACMFLSIISACMYVYVWMYDLVVLWYIYNHCMYIYTMTFVDECYLPNLSLGTGNNYLEIKCCNAEFSWSNERYGKS